MALQHGPYKYKNTTQCHGKL